jgi:prepilin-type N-terminal cleavage/methylation domain-containing protein
MGAIDKNTTVRNNRGITVMELMVVIALVAILATIAMPNFTATLPRLRLSDAARQIATDLQQIRMRAIAQNIPHQIAFSTSTYVLQRCNGPCTDDSGAIELPTGITVTTPVSAQFEPRGTAAAAATIALSNGSLSTWVCVRAAGRINIQAASCS